MISLITLITLEMERILLGLAAIIKRKTQLGEQMRGMKKSKTITLLTQT